MNLIERREKEKLDCYTIEEIYNFFNQFYDMRREYSNYIVVKEKFYLYESDVSIEIKAYGNEIYSNDIFISTWGNGFGFKQKALHLEYTERKINEDDERIYEWYIVDRSICSYTRIDKKDILPMLVDFIFENDEERYEKPLMLRRNLILDGLI
jgi:hypothetical protein